MNPADLRTVVNAVLRLAERQGYVVANDIRAEVEVAGFPEASWKDVVAQAGPSLHYRQGRYYFNPSPSPRLQAEQDQRRTIQEAVRQIIVQHGERGGEEDRRQEDRIPLGQTLDVQAEDGKVMRLLGRDLSPTGIRLISTRSLLGQKVKVALPRGEGAEPLECVVRILWTGAVSDGLFENGGIFVGLAGPEGD